MAHKASDSSPSAGTGFRQHQFVRPDDVLNNPPRRKHSEHRARKEHRETREHHERREHRGRRHHREPANHDQHRLRQQSRSRGSGKSSHHRHERRHSHGRARRHIPANGITAGNVPRADREQRDIVNEHLAAKNQQAAYVAQARARVHSGHSHGQNAKGSWLQRVKRATDKFAANCYASFNLGSDIVSARGTSQQPQQPVIGKPRGIAVLSASSEAQRLDRPPPIPPKDAIYRMAVANQAKTKRPAQASNYRVYVTGKNPDAAHLTHPGPHPTDPDYRPTTPWPRLYLSNSLPPNHDDAGYHLENVVRDVRDFQRRDVPEANKVNQPAFHSDLTRSPAILSSQETPFPSRITEHIPSSERCQVCERRAERYMLLCKTCAGLGFTAERDKSTRSVSSGRLDGDGAEILKLRLANLATSEPSHTGRIIDQLGGSTAINSERRDNDLVPPKLSIYKEKSIPKQVPLNSSNNPASAANPPRRKRSFSSGAILQPHLVAAELTKQPLKKTKSPNSTGHAASAAARFSVASNPFHQHFQSAATSPTCFSPPLMAHRVMVHGPDAKEGTVRRDVAGLRVGVHNKHKSVRPTVQHAELCVSEVSPVEVDWDAFYEQEAEPRRGEDHVDTTKRQRHVFSTRTCTQLTSTDWPGQDENRPPIPQLPRHPAARNLVPLRMPPKPAAVRKVTKDDPPSPTSVYSHASRMSVQSWEEPDGEDMKQLAGLMRWEQGESWDRAIGSVAGRPTENGQIKESRYGYV